MSDQRPGELTLVVTTARQPTAAQRERAAAVAARLGVPCVARVGLDTLWADGVEAIYRVGRDREELVSPAGQTFVHQGLLKSKLQQAGEHPLIRAVSAAGRPRRVLDATAGLLGDALHVAAATGAEVRALEGSPVIFSLLEEGVTRMRAGDDEAARAARRIEPVLADHERFLTGRTPSGERPFDVVFFDPMLERPQRAAPGFDVFRRVADPRPISEAALGAAARLSWLVVVKVRAGWRSLPAGVRWDERVEGSACDYLLHQPAVR